MVESLEKENFNIPITKVSTGKIIKISETALSLCSFKKPSNVFVSAICPFTTTSTKGAQKIMM